MKGITAKTYTMRLISGFILLVIHSLTIHSLAMAQSDIKSGKARWELGVGLGAISLPHYRGAEQSAEYLAPIPYIRYNGERLKVDREGARFFFYNTEDYQIDVSTAFALAVNSNDNRARNGMANLSTVIEIGPRFQFKLYNSEDKNLRFRFALPIRTAFAINLKQTDNIGWVVSPYLQLRYFRNGWETAISAGPIWASDKYHDYFYEVTPQYVTTDRSSYNAASGYSGSRITMTLSKRYDKLFVGIFTRYDNLSGAAFINSPLVKQKYSFMAGVAVTWIFKESK